MRIKHKSWLGVTTALALTLAGITPTQAATTPVTYGNSNCDFSAVDQGRGSVTDPFIVSAPIDLQEMAECNDRNKAVSGAVVNNDGTATFTVDATHGTLGVGQVVNISGTDGGLFDAKNVRVISATETTVTVKTKAALGDTTAAGQLSAHYSYYKLGANIDLGAVSTEPWNNNGSLSITAATKNNDGTITFTAANTLAGGETLFIDGMGDKAFNVGHVSVISATSTEFVVNTTYQMADGTASAAGGKAHFNGWQPISLVRSEIDGANFTIDGLTIYRNASNQALFGRLDNVVVRNLNFTDAVVNTTSNSSNNAPNYTGVLTGYMNATIANDVSITSSEVVTGGSNSGLLAGYIEYSSVSDINVGGRISAGLVANNAGSGVYWNNFGGVAGRGIYLTMARVTSAVEIDAFAVAQDSSVDATSTPSQEHYFENIGGILGDTYELEGRSLTATGDVTGRSYIGGAFGNGGYDGEIVNSSSSGNVFATSAAGSNREIRYVGGFAGRMQGEGDNIDIVATGNVTVTNPAGNQASVYYVGGLAGYANCCGSNTELKSSGTVTINQLGTGEVSDVGGLMGANDCCQIVSFSESTSDVVITSAASSVYQVGGFVGEWNCCATDRQNTVSGDVTVTITDTSANAYAYEIGGYGGYIDGYGIMTNLVTTGNVTVNKGYKVGGFAGFGGNEITYRDITVSGNVTVGFASPGSNERDQANVGGFAGWIEQRIVMERVAVNSNIAVTGLNSAVAKNIGGLIGGSEPSRNTILEILNSYYKGSVSGGTFVAGLIGFAPDNTSYRIERNFVAATVTATEANATVDPVINGYFQDSTKSNFFDSTLAGTADNGALFNGVATASMKSEATYTAKGWSFTGNSPWRLDAAKNGGYPSIVIPANDDNRTGSGSTTTVEKIVEKKVVIVYKTLSSINFPNKSTTLTSAQKKALTAAAKVIAKSSHTSFVVSATPKAANLFLTTARAAKVQSYLVAELRKLKSKKAVTVSVTPKANGTTTVRVQQGK